MGVDGTAESGSWRGLMGEGRVWMEEKFVSGGRHCVLPRISPLPHLFYSYYFSLESECGLGDMVSAPRGLAVEGRDWPEQRQREGQ